MYLRRLRDLREDHDLKQESVASMLGIRQTVYSRYERGFQTIPLAHLVRLADLYGVSVDYILERTDDPHIQKPKNTSPFSYPGSDFTDPDA